jgi:hypothetical protein
MLYSDDPFLLWIPAFLFFRQSPIDLLLKNCSVWCKNEKVTSAVINIYKSEAQTMHDDEAKEEKEGYQLSVGGVPVSPKLSATDIMAVGLGHEIEHTTKENNTGSNATGPAHEKTPTAIGIQILKEFFGLK